MDSFRAWNPGLLNYKCPSLVKIVGFVISNPSRNFKLLARRLKVVGETGFHLSRLGENRFACYAGNY